MSELVYVGVGIWSVILGGGAYFARRFVRAIERRRDNEDVISGISQRLAALEESMEGLRTDITRLDTGQEFAMRLLESRPKASDVPIRRRALTQPPNDSASSPP